MIEEHEPPRMARATLSTSRDDGGTWSAVAEHVLPEHAAVRLVPPARRRAGDDPCGGAKYARPSKRRACMPYGATETNEREEERDCPALLDVYRRLKMRRPKQTSRGEIQHLASLTLEAVERNDLRPLLSGGWELLRAAFATWIDDPVMHAIMNGDPCDREFRRRRAGGPRSPFASVASVLSAAGGHGLLGMSAITFDKYAANKGRTRAGWGEVECKETRASNGGVKGLGAIERAVDAVKGLRGAGLSRAEAGAILDAAAKGPLEDRLLAYRAEIIGWRWARDEKIVARVGEVAAHQRALQETRAEITKATAHISDAEIRKAIARAKQKAERHLREPPLAGKMEMGRGRKGLTADPSQLHGLIPPRDDRKRKEARI